MWKKFFAASAAAVGIAGTLGGASVFAAATISPYEPGQEIDVYTDSVTVCVGKTGGYSGDSIIAELRGANFAEQATFSDFSGNSSCVEMTGISGVAQLRYVIPMGLGGNFILDESVLSAHQTLALDLDDTAVSSNYLRVSGSSANTIGRTSQEIQFYSNGGTGSMSPIRNVASSSSVTLPRNTFTKAGRVFSSWNTREDGTGESYANGATITVPASGDLKLYAQWVESIATFDTGTTNATKMKTLAGTELPESFSFYGEDNNIKAFKKASALPDSFVQSEGNTLSADNSLVPIYAWFDNTDNAGTIYYYTEAETIKGNYSMSYMLNNCKSLTDVDGLRYIDMTSTGSVKSLLGTDTSLTDISPLEQWDVSNITSMSGLFMESSSLSNFSPIREWNVSSATDMSNMFYGTGITSASALEMKQYEGKDYISWDVSNVQNMSHMFAYAGSLANIDALSSWHIPSLKNASMMFRNTAITDVDALETKWHPGKDYPSWDMSCVEDIDGMFYLANNLEDITALASWNTMSVKDMGWLFAYDRSLLDISPIATWNTSNVEDMGRMLLGLNITDISAIETKQHDGKNYVSWDVSKVKNMDAMLAQLSITDISPLASWNTASLESMSGMFRYDSHISDISALMTVQHSGKDYVSWDVSKVKDMSNLFGGASSLSNLGALASWNTSSVKSMLGMFSGTDIVNTSALETKQQPGSNYVSWDVSNVTNMEKMFENCTSLGNISALQTWNVSSVTNMERMFYLDSTLASLAPLANWAVGTSTTMTNMFYGISAALPSWYHE